MGQGSSVVTCEKNHNFGESGYEIWDDVSYGMVFKF